MQRLYFSLKNSGQGLLLLQAFLSSINQSMKIHLMGSVVDQNHWFKSVDMQLV